MRFAFLLFTFYFFFSFGDTFAVSSSVGKVQISQSVSTEKSDSRIKIIQKVLSSHIFLGFTHRALDIIIDHTLIEPRGRMKGPRITLSSHVARDSEFLKLLTHELAHFIDIYIVSPVGATDISYDFYNISWESPFIKRAGQKQQNFVSGYAATNQYEDFAESFVFYVFHNRDFEDRAMRDDSLRQKYLFFQRFIFPNNVFVDTDFSLGKAPRYMWDTTKIPISLQKYLYSLD